MAETYESTESSEQGRRLAMYIYVLPNLVTTCNLFAGFFSVIQALRGNFLWAAYAHRAFHIGNIDIYLRQADVVAPEFFEFNPATMA